MIQKVRNVRQNNPNARGHRNKNQTPESEAVEILAHVVLNHVPVEDYCFRSKVVYITHIVRY